VSIPILQYVWLVFKTVRKRDVGNLSSRFQLTRGVNENCWIGLNDVGVNEFS